MLPNPIDSEEAANIWREDLTDAARKEVALRQKIKITSARTLTQKNVILRMRN